MPIALALLAAVSLGSPAGCTRRRESAPASVAPPRPNLTVIYASDVRGRYEGVGLGPAARGGLARRAMLVDRARLDADAVVQVDAGDLLPAADDVGVASPDQLARDTHLVLRAYRRMGVDAVTPGERELGLGFEGLKALLAETKVPMLAANVTGLAGERLFDGDRLIQVAGHKVGVFGVVDLSGELAAALPRWGFAISDPVQAARAATTSLRGRGAQVVIALVHADRGAGRTREILTAAGLLGGTGGAGADVVVLGHDVRPAGPSQVPPRSGTTGPKLVHTDPLGATVGRLDVRWGLDGGAVRIDDQLLAVTSAVSEQYGVALIGRAVTLPMIDNGRLANDPTRGATVQQQHEAAETWDYGSTPGCVLCHRQQEAQWLTTDHARALATLQGNGHDHDANCLGCHMTGFMAPGGTRNLKTATTYFRDVGCESCHGPSVQHVRSPDKHTGTSRQVDPIVCLGCHTPDQNIGSFDTAAALKEVLGPGHGAPSKNPNGGDSSVAGSSSR